MTLIFESASQSLEPSDADRMKVAAVVSMDECRATCLPRLAFLRVREIPAGQRKLMDEIYLAHHWRLTPASALRGEPR